LEKSLIRKPNARFLVESKIYQKNLTNRERIIYKIEKHTVHVYILAAGIRKQGDKKDIYQITKKLLKAGLIDL